MPAAVLVLQGLRQIPVIERGIGLDAGRQQLIDQTIVEIEPLRICRPGAFRKDARPGNREAIGLRAHLLHHRHVLLVEPVMIVGDVAGIAVRDLAGHVRKAVPDRLALAVGIRRAFDLIGRGRNAPDKAIREWRRRDALGRKRGGLAPLRRHAAPARPSAAPVPRARREIPSGMRACFSPTRRDTQSSGEPARYFDYSAPIARRSRAHSTTAGSATNPRKRARGERIALPSRR